MIEWGGKMKHIKTNQGAITLYVLIVCLFFTFILTAIYIQTINRMHTQAQEIQQIEDNYRKQLEFAGEVYDEVKKGIEATLTQNPGNDVWTKEVTLNGKANNTSIAHFINIVSFSFGKKDTSEADLVWNDISPTIETTQNTVVTENDTYYFYVTDENGEIHRSNEVVVKNIDRVNPTIESLTSNSPNPTVTITADIKDNESGVSAWQISTDPNLTPDSSGWTNITPTNNSTRVQKNVTVTGTYYLYVKDQVGNMTKQSIKVITQTRWEFGYKGSPESWTAPETGYYNITLNGAAGGISVYSVNQLGSYPRLSSKGGRVNLKVYVQKGATLYVTVGGGGGSGGRTGNDRSQSYGGYNGGGTGGIGPKRNNNPQLGQYCAGGGGGATTIAVSLNGTDGQLKSYSNESTAKNYILGAAGGGGASNHGYAGGMEYMQRDSRGGSSASGDRYKFGYGESGGDYSGYTCTQAIPSNIEGSGGGGRRLDRWLVLYRCFPTK